MLPLDLVNLTPLMARSAGAPEVRIGLIDGPVANNSILDRKNTIDVSTYPASREKQGSVAIHGTFIAGILAAERGFSAPAICPGCTLVIRPIFDDKDAESCVIPQTTPEELAEAMTECMQHNAKIINLSAALTKFGDRQDRMIKQVLDAGAKKGVVVVAAGGNQGGVVSSVITRHHSVIPVVACDQRGRPTPESNLASSIGLGGLMAPGRGIVSISPSGKQISLAGTSVAVPFVTGAIALLWSVFRHARPEEIKFALTSATSHRRTSILPPILDAEASYKYLLQSA
ncbi:S8 family peptidase [Mycobacterium sp.]|jgi:subtilisin family serine protease|uniref:S8 family peptidase n=1 Tax=Mycobacterium sp. TaxID=1785 RepID=UPI002C20274F|nr:S8 family serine peptidase [Mycobacterium sp.]HXB87037.1 S8 family serine peptidase [Mycobacterium sp.]